MPARYARKGLQRYLFSANPQILRPFFCLSRHKRPETIRAALTRGTDYRAGRFGQGARFSRRETARGTAAGNPPDGHRHIRSRLSPPYGSIHLPEDIETGRIRVA